MASKYMKYPLCRHLIYVTVAAVAVLIAYFAFFAAPRGSVVIEAEGFTALSGRWVPFEDVNFSGARGLMTDDPGAAAEATFTLDSAGEYTLWLKYFGNYAPTDIGYWKRVYTNSLGYLDYNGAVTAQTMAASVDSAAEVSLIQDGSHRYRWARINRVALDPGTHRLVIRGLSQGVSGVAGERTGFGSVNFDNVLITGDPHYSPGNAEALPRQISEYFSVVLIALFPLVVWATVRRAQRETAGLPGARVETESALPRRSLTTAALGYPGVYLLYSTILALLLSVMWIDSDGGFWIWLAQSRDFTLSTIYSAGDALHHRYVYPPPVAAMLVAIRPVLSLFGAMDGITVSSIIISKLAVVPFALATGALLYRIEGRIALLLWSLNSVVLFTVAANSMYFGLSFLMVLCIYLLKQERHYLAALSLGLSLAYMSAAMLMIPPFFLCLRGAGLRKMAAMAALALLPGFLVFLPYSLIDPAGMNARVMSAGISTWMSMHLGLRLGGVGLTPLLYGALMAYLWVRRPRLDYVNVSIVFALTSLIYFNIGAPYFMAWTVAFQPMVIVVSRRLRQEVFYSFYVTALMVWASFYMNTGGAGDRAGETGFFPYYIFYTWPFDVYSFVGRFYGRIAAFSPVELESVAHSVSAGVSVVMFLMILFVLARPEGAPALVACNTVAENRYE